MVYNRVRPLELYILAPKNLKSGGGCDKEKSTQVIIIIPTLRSQWLFHMGRKKNYYKLQVTCSTITITNIRLNRELASLTTNMHKLCVV